MKKSPMDILKEYVKRLNDDDLKWISVRLSRRLGGDLVEALDVVQQHPDLERWLGSATSANDFFDIIDQMDSHVQQETKKRLNNNYESKKTSTLAR